MRQAIEDAVKEVYRTTGAAVYDVKVHMEQVQEYGIVDPIYRVGHVELNAKLPQLHVRVRRGETVTVRQPLVLRDLCIGCGICEYQCPLNGEAAIRVYVPNAFNAIATSRSLPLIRAERGTGIRFEANT